ncbi:MAG: vWA domain-containing protein [Longimicrobiales bacterium]
MAVAGCRPDPQPTLADVPPLERCELPPDSLRQLIVLDQSGSMRPAWSTVRAQMAAIVEAMPEGSWLHIEGFSDRVATLVHDVRIDAAMRPTVVEQARRLPLPRNLAPTDIGAALEAALDDVLRARSRGRGRVTLVFFITDGKHEPSAQSPYRDTELFTKLRARWAKHVHDPTLHPFIYAIPVGGGLEGADLVQRTVPTAVVVPPMRHDQMSEVVADIIGRVGKDVKRALVVADDSFRAARLHARLAGEPKMRRLGATAEADIIVRSAAACVTYDLSRIQLAASSGDFSGSAPDGVRVTPGDSAVVRATLRARHPLSHWLPGSAPMIDTVGMDRRMQLSLSVSTTLEPAPPIEELLRDPGPASTAITIEGTLQRMPISWIAFVCLVTPPLLVLLGVGYGALPPKPAAFRPTMALDSGNRRVQLDSLRRTPDGKRVLRSLPNGTTILITCRRASWLGSRKRVRVIVEADRPGVVGIAEPKASAVGHQVTMLSAHAPVRELAKNAYVVWAANGEPLPGALELGDVDHLPGYRWPG